MNRPESPDAPDLPDVGLPELPSLPNAAPDFVTGVVDSALEAVPLEIDITLTMV